MHFILNFYQSPYNHWMHFEIQYRQYNSYSLIIICQIAMFKQSGTSASTKILRKTKTNESYKQVGLNKPKIMLTDLCPQEKAKIGELVRTLEMRKKQNKNLQERLKQMLQEQTRQQSKISELQRVIEEYRFKQIQFKEQITLAKVKQEEKERYINHLLNEKQSVLKERKTAVALVDQFSMTEPTIKTEQGCQVAQKKKKMKNREIQTDLQMNRNIKNSRRKANSRSFDKIMKKKNFENQSNYNEKKGKSAIRISDQDQYGQNQRQKFTQEYLNEEEQSEDFDELAKKWLQLKQRNMTKIKQSLTNSKNRASSHSGDIKNRYRHQKEQSYPRGFDEEYYEETQKQKNYNNDSFGPNQNRNEIQQFQVPEAQFDELELNKILKSKDFSASRLMHQNRLNSQESSRQKSLQSLSKRHKRGSTNQARINLKTSNMSNSPNIDFYQTDLLDIVNSIKP